MSDFNGTDYDFALGSILGMRSWGMDDKGRLHGVTHREVWLPGENVSVCKAERRVTCPEVAKKRARAESERGARTAADQDYYIRFELDDFMYSADPCGEPGCYSGTHPAEPDHRFAADCECGFWAYDEHTFTPHGDVVGIIEGYGRTTVGTRGFRCEKARIVALCREKRDGYLSLSAWLRLQQLYPGAKFYEDEEDMTSRHGGVLRQWPDASAEDFWHSPVPGPKSSWAAALLPSTMHITAPSYSSLLRRSLASAFSSAKITGGSIA